jgi:hypothetical protein
MTITKLQATQTVLHDVLSELGNTADAQLNTIFDKFNTLSKVPGLIALGTGLVINVGTTTLIKPNGTKIRLVLGDVDVGDLSGSMDFATGIGTGIETVTLPALTANQWYKAGFEIRSDKKIYVVFGAIGASEALAGFPNWNEVSIALGYVSLQANGTGTAFVAPTAANINQFEGDSSLEDHTLLANRSSADQHPTTSISTTTAQFSGGELSATEDEVQKALVRLGQYDSVFDWTIGRTYRVGNLVKATGLLGATIYRCTSAHTAASGFDDAQFELLVSAQNHDTLANKGVSGQHPTTSITTVTGEFTDALNATEDEVQKALVRLQAFNSIKDWEEVSYRVGNIVNNEASIYECIIAHTASGTINFANFNRITTLDHTLLSNTTDAALHPTTSIFTVLADFNNFLSAEEDDSQKAFDRIDDYSSLNAFNTSGLYRVNNVVIHDSEIYTCNTAHAASGGWDLSKWTLVNLAPTQEAQSVTGSSQTVFTLTSIVVPVQTSRLSVFVNGLYHEPTEHYTVDTSTQITFTSPVLQNGRVLFKVS